MARWVESEEQQKISKILSDVNIWFSSCRDAIASPFTDPNVPLKDLLSRVRLFSTTFSSLLLGYKVFIDMF